jgi:hypothetical protein
MLSSPSRAFRASGDQICAALAVRKKLDLSRGHSLATLAMLGPGSRAGMLGRDDKILS